MTITTIERQLSNYATEIAELTLENRALKAQLEYMETEAETDALTGIPNRRAIMKQAVLPQDAALIMLDLDGFKAMNDHNGHAAGDTALKYFAAFLDNQGFFAYRLGGDEFALVIPVAHMPLVGKRIREWGYTLDGVRVTASHGSVAALAGPISLDQAMRQADAALYADKETKGRRNPRRRNRG